MVMLALVLAIGAAGFGASPRGAGGPRGASPHRRRWPRALDTGAFTTPRERMIYTKQARRSKDRPYAQRRHPGIERSYGLTWDKHQTCRGRAGERGPLLQEHVTEANELLRGRAGHSVDLTENVLKEKPEPGRRLLFREDVLYQCEDIGNGVQFEHLYELSDVLRVAGPRSERLHSEEMFG
jgi:hypothetical protein